MGDDENTNAAGHLDAAWRASRVDAIPPTPTYTAAEAALAAARDEVADLSGQWDVIDSLELVQLRAEVARLTGENATARELIALLEGEQERAEVAEARAANLTDFLADFAATDFPALPYARNGRSPEDDPDPVTDAITVWAWQKDARALIGGQGNG
jgi:hypothetical protein